MHLEIRTISVLQELFESLDENGKEFDQNAMDGILGTLSVAPGKFELSSRCFSLCLHASNLMPCPALVAWLTQNLGVIELWMCHCCFQQWKNVDLVVLQNFVLLAKCYKFCPLLSQLFCLMTIQLCCCLEKFYITLYHLCNFLQFQCRFC